MTDSPAALGVARDPDEAVRLLRLAADHGHADAESVLRRLNVPATPSGAA
jgi:TPR repeat protein